jgi:uncharacterized integral membrane protein
MTVVATVLLVLFGIQNSDHVAVNLLLGPPTQVRLIFLLLIAAGSGFLASYIRGLSQEIRLKKQIRQLIAIKSAEIARLPEQSAYRDD